MALDLQANLFIDKRDTVLYRDDDGPTDDPVNHLIMGDYARYLGEQDGNWVKIRSRGNNGWIEQNKLTNERMLEINFVDIGQGDGCHIVTPDDEVILVDAGEGKGFSGKGGDNMLRFLSWRYNLRRRKVTAEGEVELETDAVRDPIVMDYAIITHPDLDHYYGFHSVFQNQKLKFKTVCHNGIVERSKPDDETEPWYYDLGKKVESEEGDFLWDTVLTNREMHDLLDAQARSRKYYLKTLRAARENNDQVKFEFLHRSKKFFDHFDEHNPLTIEILAPFTECIEKVHESRDCLITLGGDGKTKNGHSVVLKLTYGKLKMLLGGDLNANSQDYLAQKYSEIDVRMSELEKDIRKIKEELSTETDFSISERRDKKQELEEKEKLLDLCIARTRRLFECDIAKACHHGASDVLDSFLFAINPIATVISSGDNESYSHPRPDALGAFGKSSRGDRPLIFSTELARSSHEFSYPIKYYGLLKRIEQRMEDTEDETEKKNLKHRMETMRDSNIAKYGMITVRSDGERVIISQKLEQKRSNAQKWDIYELHWNPKLEEFEYTGSTGGH